MNASNKVKYRVEGMEIFFMVFFALIADLLTLIPLVGMVVGWIFWRFIYGYLILIRGIRPNRKGVASGLVSSILELIPLIQMLPTITAGVILIILSTRRDDKKKAVVQKKPVQEEASKKISPQETSVQ